MCTCRATFYDCSFKAFALKKYFLFYFALKAISHFTVHLQWHFCRQTHFQLNLHLLLPSNPDYQQEHRSDNNDAREFIFGNVLEEPAEFRMIGNNIKANKGAH